MKYFVTVLLSVFIFSTTEGDVWLDLYEADGETPYDGHPLMVGQSLVVIVASDTADDFSGGAVVLEGNDPNLGIITCRDPGGMGLCDESALPAAGEFWYIYTEIELGVGYHYGAGEETTIGNWFVFDYTATNVGDPEINLYKEEYPDIILADQTNPIIQVPRLDFDDDDSVNLGELAVIANQWMSSGCSDQNNWCQQADFNHDSYVDIFDLAILTELWLEFTG